MDHEPAAPRPHILERTPLGRHLGRLASSRNPHRPGWNGPLRGGHSPLEMLTEKLLMLERILLRHDYQDLLLATRGQQLHDKVMRLIRLKEDQIRLLDDLLKEQSLSTATGRPLPDDGGLPPT